MKSKLKVFLLINIFVTIFFQKIVFAKFPKYVPSVTQKNCVNYITLLNYSNNNKFKELASWIESQYIWKTIPEPTRIGDVEIDE